MVTNLNDEKPIQDKESYNFQFNKNKNIVFIYSKTDENHDMLINELKSMFYSLRIELEIGTDYLNIDKISVIIFKNYNDYLNVFETEFEIYLAKNKIGLIIFNGLNSGEDIKITECKLNDKNLDFMNNFLHLTKFNTESIRVEKQIKHDKKFEKLFYDEKNLQSKSLLICSINESFIEDLIFINKVNNIQHVLVSLYSLSDVWLLKLLLVDSIRYLSNGKIETGLKRYIQIDIDDIFLFSKMIPEDVYEMIRFQNEFTKSYFFHNNYKFKFTIGYSGHYFYDERTYVVLNIPKLYLDSRVGSDAFCKLNPLKESNLLLSP